MNMQRKPTEKDKIAALNNAVIFGPSFIGVGPEKTGTTWIDRNLRAHKSINMPPLKEMRYFWENSNYPQENFFQRMNANESWHREQYVDYAKKRLKSLLKKPVQTLFVEYKRFIWDLKYILMPHNDDWYIKSFRSNAGKISGEISPQYFFLPASQIEAISKVLPNCKVIITLREPVDWIWSFARMGDRLGFLQKKFGSIEAFIQFKSQQCSFSESLATWRSFYAEDQLLILYYDELCESPWAYYKKICCFLGIKPDEQLEDKVKEKVNPGHRSELPDHLIEIIQNAWKEDMMTLSEMLPDLPEHWLSNETQNR